MKFNLEKKDKVRQVESTKQRNLHYIFNPTTTLQISPFSRKFLRLNDGTLDDFEKEEREKFDAYIERVEAEELEENETNPVIYEDNPFFTFDLTCLNRIAFGVAVDPFYKPLRAKY